MDHEEARSILRTELDKYRGATHSELQRLLTEQDVKEVAGGSGKIYQIEIEAEWDDRTGGNIRVLGHVDDGGIRALAPLSDDFIVAPDGSFVGE
jgi:hypothetical protein